jgi:hypothetical protein
MKIRYAMSFLFGLCALGSALAAGPTANSWFPGGAGTPAANTGLAVRYAIIDYRYSPPVLQIQLADGSPNGAEALFRFNPANSSEVARANMYLASLLTAQASGQKVILHLDASANIDAIIYGDY